MIRDNQEVNLITTTTMWLKEEKLMMVRRNIKKKRNQCQANSVLTSYKVAMDIDKAEKARMKCL